MTYWHIRLSSENRLPLFESEARRRRALCVMVRVLAGCLVLFCVVDDHAHVVIVCPEELLARIRSSLWQSLAPIVDQPLAPSYVKRVENRHHLERLVRYFLEQTDHHGLSENPALYSGSCYQDLIGARIIDGWQPRLFTALPRWREEDLHRIVGLPADRLAPASDDAVRAAGAPRVAFAAAMSNAADPSLRGNAASTVLARTVAAHVGAAAGIAREEMSWPLDITPRALRRMEARPVTAEQTRAARLCIALVDRAYPELSAFRLVPPVAS